jgi:hypothetical protein
MSAFGNSPLVLGGNSLSVASGTSPVGTAGITATQVAYGDTVANTIKGIAAFTFTEGTGVMKLGVSGSANSISITGDTNGGVAIAAAGTSQSIALTPSGTGQLTSTSDTFVGLNLVRGTTATAGRGVRLTNGAGNYWQFGTVGSSSSPANALAFAYTDINLPNATGFLFTSDSRFLLGTATDSSNGRLQLATHTTSAGGIGFGVETEFFRSAAGQLSLNHSAGISEFRMLSSGTVRGRLFVSGSNFAVAADTNNLLLQSNNTTAITLDGSQNMFATGTTSVMGGSTTGATRSKARLIKAVTGIADAAATAVCTVTIPNAAHSATLRIKLTGSLGAGGAIGANEATGTIGYDFAIARTAGVNAVTTASAAYGSATASVAGAATITITAAASAIAGAVGASNTFTVDVTITRGSGASTNHTCLVYAEVLNANATGITVA